MTMVKYSPPRRGGELLLRTWGTLIERHIQHQDIYARFTQETEIRSFRILRDQRLNLIHRNLRALATRAAWTSAFAGLMCGSRPDDDAVTASGGIGAFALNSNSVLSSLKAFISFTSSSSPFASLNWSSGIDNVNFAGAPAPPVDMPALKAATELLSAKIATAADGGKTAIAQRNHQKEVVVKLL